MTNPHQDIPLEEIWEGDLFNRQEEAQMLMAYLESVAGRHASREDKKAYSIAIDAGYGEGKSFFLRRFAKHLATKHPVAFVDAWSDDLADEPLTALAATLKRALEPLIGSSPAVKKKWASVVEKTGAVAKIAAVGLFKRGVGLLITQGAVEAADAVMSEVRPQAADLVQDDLKSSGKDAVEGFVSAATAEKPKKLMESRIASFEEGQAAIQSLKDSLTDLIAILRDEEKQPPIVIIIDELDRCRPTYAVKLLEEIKHLFDVPGLVFVFGMHGDQLAHSVSWAYGSGFNGRAYLRRFINREYRLRSPDLTPLVTYLMSKAGLDQSRLVFPPVPKHASPGVEIASPGSMIARYLKQFDVSARDVFQVIDTLQTCLALTKASLLGGYLVPLIISRMKGGAQGDFMEEGPDSGWHYEYPVHDRFGSSKGSTTFTSHSYARTVANAAANTERELMRIINANENLPVELQVFELRQNQRLRDDPLADPKNYPELLETVGRFSNPALQEPAAESAGTEGA